MSFDIQKFVESAYVLSQC